jgi:hypothetical protein
MSLTRPFSSNYMDRIAFRNGNYCYSFDNLSRTMKERNQWISDAIRFKKDLVKLKTYKGHVIIHVGGYLLESIIYNKGNMPKQFFKEGESRGYMKSPTHLNSTNDLCLMVLLPEKKEHISDDQITTYLTKFYNTNASSSTKVSILGIYRCAFPSVIQTMSVSNILNKKFKTNIYKHGKPTITDMSYNYCGSMDNFEKISNYDEKIHGKINNSIRKSNGYTFYHTSVCGVPPTSNDIKFTESIKDIIVEIAHSGKEFTIFNDAVLDMHKLHVCNDEVYGSLFFGVLSDIFYSLADCENPNFTMIETGYSTYDFWRYRYWSYKDQKVKWYNDLINNNTYHNYRFL